MAGHAAGSRQDLSSATGAQDQRKRVLVLVPTTGSVNRVVRIEARPDLKVSQVIHRYWPVAISRYYAALTEGPLAALGAPVTPGVYRLLLADEIESGNSWELPALLAHLVVALGHELVDEAARADIVLWSTGEIDSSLRLRACDYRLAAKAARSRDELQQAAAAGARIIAIAPAGADASPLRSVLAGTPEARVESVDNACAARGIIEQELGGVVPAAPPALQAAGGEIRGLFWKVPALLATGAAMMLAVLIAGNLVLPAPLAQATPPRDPATFQEAQDPGTWSCTPATYDRRIFSPFVLRHPRV
jgi:hypothetical protein